MRKGLVSAVALLCLVLSTHTFSQTSNATLGGIISDATGALIPGVTITATNTGTGIVTTVLTNEAGAYQFASLQTGSYAVTAELPGFQTQTRSGVALGVSQQVRLNFTLQVGSVAQTVEVSVAADTLIATSSSSVGTVLPEYKIRDMPLGGRNVMDLLGAQAGTGPTEDNFDGFFAGGRLNAVNVTRDGFNVTDGRYNYGALTNTYTSPDLVEEVRIITAPVDAEIGRGSGQVQMVTRSGSAPRWADHQEQDVLLCPGGRTALYLPPDFRRVGADRPCTTGHLPVFPRSRRPERDSAQSHGGPQWQSGETAERDRRSSIL